MRALIAILAFLAWPAWCQTEEVRKLTQEDLKLFFGTYLMLLDQYVTPLDRPELLQAAVQGMLREVDPEGGEYWSAEDFKNYRDGPPAGTGSVGIELRRRNGALVVFPVATGPAFDAGIRFADHLRTVDGVPVAANTTERALRLTDGPVGSTVLLGVYRPSEDKVLEFTVRRSNVEWPSASISTLADDVRWLRLPSLWPSRLRRALALFVESWAKGPFSWLVLDLRGNQGGPIDSSVALAAAFLPTGAVVGTLAGRSPGSNRVYRAMPSDYAQSGADDPQKVLPEGLRSVALVVLVDGQTSAGAEIVVAALKESRRAVVVGHPTYGRGSVQIIRPIGELGAIRFTNAYWLTPSGSSFHQAPLQPDRLVSGSDDASFAAAALQVIEEARGSGRR